MGGVRTRRSTRRALSILAIFALVAGTLAALAPAAAGVVNTCRARNVTRDTPLRADLQAVIDAATSGDTITVKFVCVGNFSILGKQLTLLGRPTPDHPKAVLDAAGSGTVLLVNAQVRLTNLKITGGKVRWPVAGAGIRNDGALTLKDTVVSGNTARAGDLWDETPGECGGISNDASLVLAGTTSVRRNAADNSGGGICNGGSVTMKGSSSLSGNWSGQWGGGIEGGTIIMKDSSSVRGNTGRWGEGGIRGGIVTMNDSSSVTGNTGGGIDADSLTMNGSSSVRGNTGTFGGGIYAVFAVTMNDSSSVRGNMGDVGGGIYGGFVDGTTVTMNGSSSVRGNSATRRGGGISLPSGSSLTLNDSSSVKGNRADFDDDGNGTGGGVFAGCGSTLTGAVDGGNVNDNYLGSIGTDENNIADDC